MHAQPSSNELAKIKLKRHLAIQDLPMTHFSLIYLNQDSIMHWFVVKKKKQCSKHSNYQPNELSLLCIITLSKYFALTIINIKRNRWHMHIANNVYHTENKRHDSIWSQRQTIGQQFTHLRSHKPSCDCRNGPA